MKPDIPASKTSSKPKEIELYEPNLNTEENWLEFKVYLCLIPRFNSQAKNGIYNEQTGVLLT